MSTDKQLPKFTRAVIFYILRIKVDFFDPLTLNVSALWFTETSVTSYHSARCNKRRHQSL